MDNELLTVTHKLLIIYFLFRYLSALSDGVDRLHCGFSKKNGNCIVKLHKISTFIIKYPCVSHVHIRNYLNFCQLFVKYYYGTYSPITC